MKKPYFQKKLLAAFILTGVLGLSACGGSSNDSATPATSGGTSSTTKTITGKAVDGYLVNSMVCLDLSGDGYCQVATEPMGNTDATGGFSLAVTDAHTQHANYHSALLLVFDGKDSDTGKRYEGKLFAPNDGTTINITPATTLVAKKVEAAVKKAKKEGNTLNEAAIKAEIAATKKIVAQALGMPDNFDINQDPVALAAGGDAEAKQFLASSLALHRSIEVMVAAAKKDDKLKDKSTSDLTDDIFIALLNSVDQAADNGDSSVEKIMEQAQTNADFKTQMGDSVANAAQVATTTAKKTFSLVNEADLSSGDLTDIKKASIQTNTVVNAVSSKFEDSAFITSLEAGEGFNESTFFTEIDALEFNPIIDIINSLGIALNASDKASLENLTIPDDFDYTPEAVLALDDLPADIKTKVENFIKRMDAEDAITQLKYTKATDIPFPNSFSLYDLDHDSYEYTNGNGEIIEEHDYFLSNIKLDGNQFSSTGYDIRNVAGSAIFTENQHKPDESYLLINGEWQLDSDDNTNQITLDDDRLRGTSDDGFSVRIVNEEDIGGQDIFFPEIDSTVLMPAGAKNVVFEITQPQSQIRLSYKPTTDNQSSGEQPYTSFDDFITKKTVEGGGYNNVIAWTDKGDLHFSTGTLSDATSGTLTLNENGDTVATWKFIMLGGLQTLEITPTPGNEDLFTYSSYQDDGETNETTSIPIYSLKEGAIWKGYTTTFKGFLDISVFFNETAYNAIKTYIEQNPEVIKTSTNTNN